MQKLILVAQALYRKRCGNRLSKIQKVRRRFLIGSGCFRCKAEVWWKMRGDRYRSRGDGKNCQPALPIWRICRLSRLPAGIFVARLTAGRVLLATLPAEAFFMQIPSQGGVRCRQAFRRQSLRCGGAQVASFGRHFRASVPVVSGGIFHLASWRIFSSCAVWPALVCTLEILLGLLTSARRYVLIKVGVAEAPLFTPTHSCLRPLRL